MGSTRASESRREAGPNPPRDQSGIALFMVIAAISVLSILVTEFTYIAQVNQKMAFDGLDQLKAHYLAKSGFKLSLLRLKAYQNVKGVVGTVGGGKGIPGVPKNLIEKIWSFPFFYPIPTNVPGMTPGDKELIDKFQKGSGLEGRFSAQIESESSKYNLNLILAPFAPSATPSPGPSPSPQPSPSPSPPAPAFNPEEARNSLGEYLNNILRAKVEGDPDFAADYRDVRVEDLLDSIVAWADFTYERRSAPGKELIPPKRGPFYSLSELHMISGMDDRLYELFAPALTVSTTPGINVNTMGAPTLKALVPGITEEETKAFFEFRDTDEEDNLFKDADAFFKYLQTNIGIFRGSDTEVSRYKEALQKRQVRIVVEETEFKITVQAQVNQSTRLLEAWITLGGRGKKTATPASTPGSPPGSPPAAAPPLAGPGATAEPDPGLRVTFMRIL